MKINSAGHSRLLVANPRRSVRFLFRFLLLVRFGRCNSLVRLIEHSFVGCNNNIVDTLIELTNRMASDFGGKFRVQDTSVDSELVQKEFEPDGDAK